MKLQVQGIEEIEITDPKGLCNPPSTNPQLPSQPWPSQPWPPNTSIPMTPSIYPKPLTPKKWDHWYRPGNWGVGAIQQAGNNIDPETGNRKWQENWHGAEMNGE